MQDQLLSASYLVRVAAPAAEDAVLIPAVCQSQWRSNVALEDAVQCARVLPAGRRCSNKTRDVLGLCWRHRGPQSQSSIAPS